MVYQGFCLSMRISKLLDGPTRPLRILVLAAHAGPVEPQDTSTRDMQAEADHARAELAARMTEDDDLAAAVSAILRHHGYTRAISDSLDLAAGTGAAGRGAYLAGLITGLASGIAIAAAMRDLDEQDGEQVVHDWVTAVGRE
jgi:hypothetical protein